MSKACLWLWLFRSNRPGNTFSVSPHLGSRSAFNSRPNQFNVTLSMKHLFQSRLSRGALSPEPGSWKSSRGRRNSLLTVRKLVHRTLNMLDLSYKFRFKTVLVSGIRGQCVTIDSPTACRCSRLEVNKIKYLRRKRRHGLTYQANNKHS